MEERETQMTFDTSSVLNIDGSCNLSITNLSQDVASDICATGQQVSVQNKENEASPIESSFSIPSTSTLSDGRLVASVAESLCLSSVEVSDQNAISSTKGDVSQRRLFTKVKKGVKRSQDGEPKTDETVPTKRRRRKKPLEKGEAEEILDNMEGEIDKVLEETAQKNKLTAANVKNILWHVITNQHVLSMVRNTMIDGNCDLSEIEEAEFEPKLTRAKVKEMKEKQSDLPWPVTPVKATPLAPSTQLLAKEFANDESSSDEEYHPAIEEESEDDDECAVSPQTSDVSSPDHRQSAVSTPVQPDIPEPQEASTSGVQDTEDNDGIALRTRSKLPLNDMPLEMIEASFVPPDFTVDMYDSDCGDEDWKNFLTDFCKPLETLETAQEPQDELNDPEYNFLEDEDVLDSWDLRYDKAVKITKKEWNELIASLLDAGENGLGIGCGGGEDEDDDISPPSEKLQDGNQPLVEDQKKHNEASSPSSPSLSTNPVPPVSTPIISLSPEERSQLDQHMRMHVQLLTQTYLLSRHHAKYRSCALGAKTLLMEIKNFTTREQSAFNAYNLDESLELVTKFGVNNSGEKSSNWLNTSPIRSSKVEVNILKEDKLTMIESKVFMYPELLPLRGPKMFRPENEKVRFTLAEDYLIALGLEQFSPLTKFNAVKLTNELLVPIKTEKQIQLHIKNFRFNRKIPDSNPIKYYKKHNVVPPFERVLQAFSPETVCAPADMARKLLPDWMVALLLSKQHKSKINPSNKYHTITIKPQKSNSPMQKFQPLRNTRRQPLIRPKPKHPTRLFPLPVPMPRTPTKHMSPLKQISPILKKYHKGPRNTSKSQFLTVPFMSLLQSTENAGKGYKPLLPRPDPSMNSKALTKCASVRESSNQNSLSSGILTRRKVKDSCTELERKEEQLVGQTGVEVDQMTQNQMTFIPTENSHIKDVSHGRNDSENTGTTVSDVREVTSDDVEYNEAHNEADMSEDVEADGYGEVEGEEERVDNEGDLAALMAASSTICKRNPNALLKKKNKQKRDVESLMNLIAEDLVQVDPLKDERESAYAEMYLVRVKETLRDDEDTYRMFLQTLCEFEKSGKSVVELYGQLKKIFSNYPELVEDFVMFLLPEQAEECGRLTDYLLFQKMRVFLRKIEVHFSKQPQHIQKIMRALNQIQKQRDLTLEKVRATFYPLLRGQPHLLEEFLQLLPQEHPPESWMTEFEEITIPDSDDDHSDDGFETFALPEVQDSYGTNSCPCTCHQETLDPRFQNRIRHCVRCGIKFVGGKIYLQTGRRTLKPAQIIYKDKEQLQMAQKESLAHGISCSGLSSTHKTEDSPVSSSNTKVSKSLDEKVGRDEVLNPLPSLLSQGKGPSISVKDDASRSCSHVCNVCGDNLRVASDQDGQTSNCSRCENSPSKSCKELLNSFLGNKGRDPIQFTVTSCVYSKVTNKATHSGTGGAPVSGQHYSNELENKQVCSTNQEVSLANTSPFTREEDRILLHTCQQKGATSEVFEEVSRLLKNRSTNQVQERFLTLMKIMEEKIEASEDDSNL